MIASQDSPKFAYLRNRPFLVVDIYITPAVPKGQERTRTERKGWMKNENNISHSEDPHIVDRVKDKHLTQATVIIDLLRDTVIKNRLDDSNEAVLTHYKQKYSSMINQGQTTWANRATTQMKDFEMFKRSHMKTQDRAASQISAPVARAVSRKV